MVKDGGIELDTLEQGSVTRFGASPCLSSVLQLSEMAGVRRFADTNGGGSPQSCAVSWPSTQGPTVKARVSRETGLAGLLGHTHQTARKKAIDAGQRRVFVRQVERQRPKVACVCQPFGLATHVPSRNRLAFETGVTSSA